MPGPLGIIPTYLSTEYHLRVLEDCLRSIRATEPDLELLIVDDDSPLKTKVEFLHDNRKEYDYHYIEKYKNEGFSKTVNLGLADCVTEKRDAILINSDIEFTHKDWVKLLSENTDYDITGALLLFPNGIIQHAGIYFSPITLTFDHRFKGAPGNLPAALEPCECPVTAALQFIRYSTLTELGLYDEDYRLGFEDVDYQIRAMFAGKKMLYNPEVKAIHHESLFRGNISEKHDEWQNQSFMTLLDKHSDKDFYGKVPTMHD